MAVSFKLTMPDLTALASDLGNADQSVLAAWGADAETLLQIEEYNVTQRTLDRANDTGALASSVTGQAYGDAKNGTIIAVWFNNAQQYAEWGRYYAPYQEGPPIGLSTYTNAPRHMLFDAQTEDAGQIHDWAVRTGQHSLEGLGADLAE
jgi:hypothetical protein